MTGKGRPSAPPAPPAPPVPPAAPPGPPAPPAPPPGPPYGYVDDKEALSKRMRRIQGQARGIEKMIAEDRYCIDILTQIAAIGTALDAVALEILDDHVKHCVAHALASGDEAAAAEKSRELLDAVHRFTRTR